MLKLMRLSIAIQLLIFILPFIVMPQVFNPYEYPKFIFFVVGVEILALYFVWTQLKKNKLRIPKIGIDVILVVGFGIVTLISDVLGVDPKISLLGSNIRHQGFLTLLSGIILFLLVRFSFDTKSYTFFKKAVLICALLLSFISIWQVLQINVFNNYSIPTYNNRIVGTMGNPNFLGGYLAMLLPFVLFNVQRKLKSILISAVVSFFILASIFFTDSRSAFIAVAFVLLGYLIHLFRKTIVLKITIFIVLIFIAVGLIQSINNFTQKKEFDARIGLSDQEIMCHAAWPKIYPLKFVTDIQANNERSSFCDSRLLVWLMGIEAVIKRPIIGYGQDNFELAIPSGKMHVTDNAHNIFLETAISSGMIGLMLFVGIIILALKKASLTVRLSLIAFLIIAQFNPLSIAQISLFWFLLAISKRSNE